MQNSVVLEAHNTTLLVSDLYPNNLYVISVSAFTISEGPFTEDLQVTTSEDGEFYFIGIFKIPVHFYAVAACCSINYVSSNIANIKM